MCLTILGHYALVFIFTFWNAHGIKVYISRWKKFKELKNIKNQLKNSKGNLCKEPREIYGMT